MWEMSIFAMSSKYRTKASVHPWVIWVSFFVNRFPICPTLIHILVFTFSFFFEQPFRLTSTYLSIRFSLDEDISRSRSVVWCVVWCVVFCVCRWCWWWWCVCVCCCCVVVVRVCGVWWSLAHSLSLSCTLSLLPLLFPFLFALFSFSCSFSCSCRHGLWLRRWRLMSSIPLLSFLINFGKWFRSSWKRDLFITGIFPARNLFFITVLN